MGKIHHAIRKAEVIMEKKKLVIRISEEKGRKLKILCALKDLSQQKVIENYIDDFIKINNNFFVM